MGTRIQGARLLIRPFAFAATLALLPAGAASAEPRAWNQAAVTKLAGELVEAARAVRDAHRRTPPPHIGSPNSRALLKLGDDLRLIANEARHLEHELERGKGRSDTHKSAVRIQGLIANAAEETRRIPALGTLPEKLEAANLLVAQLAEFYGLQTTARSGAF